MTTLQGHIQNVCNSITNHGIVRFRNYYGSPGYAKLCVGIDGGLGECMLIVGQVIKEMGEALSAIAEKSGAGELLPEHRIDAEILFAQNVDTLLNFSITATGRFYVVFWPSLEPIHE